MNNQVFASKLKDAATKYKTLYILGCFGAPMNAANKKRYTNNLEFNKKDNRKSKIEAASSDTFGFDCSGLVKGILWGWNGDKSKSYGGATYQSNGVPDIGADAMINKCSGVSTDFSNIEVGELLWMKGHVGVYVGDGLAVECTHRWSDGVQFTAVHNIGKKSGYNGRAWTKHGKLPYIEYVKEQKPVAPTPAPAPTTNSEFSVGMRTMRRGDKGEDVRALQILLAGRGCNGKMHTPDGAFGPNTEGAVKIYQEKVGLTVDGVAGTNTWNKLLGIK